MRNYIGIMIITALIINVVGAVLNQIQYYWDDWKFVFNSVWEFGLFIGGFYLYSKSKFRMWYFDLAFIFVIGFSTINLIHSVYGTFIWILSNRGIREILMGSFEEYNFIFALIASALSIVGGLIYMINLPNMLNRD